MINNRRGNPNWGRPQVPSLNAAEKPTMFSLFLQDQGIAEEGCEQHMKVRIWVRKHAKLYYIPEELLRLCNAEVRSEDLNL